MLGHYEHVVVALTDAVGSEVTFGDRSKMTCPLLLGQKFLSNRYLVDVGLNRIQGKPTCP